MLMRPPEYLDSQYGAIKRKIDSDYTANQAVWQQFWTDATIDTRLEAGDTSLMAEFSSSLPNNNKGQWYFNRVRPLCNMVSGYQRRNRKSTVVVPLENADNETADQWTKILLHIYKKENIYELLSQAFHHGACITGMNLLQVYIDWQNDPISGDIKVDNIPYNYFMIDPYFKKNDLSDASFIWTRRYVSHSVAANLMPEHYDAIMALPGNPTGTGRDGRFQYAAESYGQTQQNRLAYDEYYYRDVRKQKLLIDKITGESFELNTQDQEHINRFLAENPQVELYEHEIPTVRLAISIQDKIFYDGPNPLGIDCMPFVPVLGYYNSMTPYFYSRIQGICRSLRDPQILLNRRIILSADLLESQVNSGFIFKENAPVDVKHLFQTGQGRIIPIKEEAQMSDIMPIVPPQIPPSFFQLQDTFSKELNLVSGINEELMGSALDDKAGILSALRQGAGLTTLQPLFDNLDMSQVQLGEVIMKIVRANYTPGKIKNILEGKQPAPLFFDKAFGKYHCMVELGFNTESQKQMQFAQLIQLKEMGVGIPDKWLLNAATIQNKTEIMRDIEENQKQQAQMQQAQMQSQMQEAQARSELAYSRAAADIGLRHERDARVVSDQALAVQKLHEARKNDEQAALDKIRALKELEDIDLTHLHKIIQIQKLLKEMEQPSQIEQPQPNQMSEVR